MVSSADNKATIMDDSFIRSYIGELLRSLRTQYLIDLIKPYTRLELTFLAKVWLRHDSFPEIKLILSYSNSTSTSMRSRSF